MPSYVITGVSKGLGFEFLSQLSSDSNNTVIGIVRDKATTDKKISEELDRRCNIYILQADLLDYTAIEVRGLWRKLAMRNAAKCTAEITGGSLDYLIANAGYVSHWDAYEPIGVFSSRGNDPKQLEDDFLKSFKTNVIANIHLMNLFIPLLLKSNIKKVISLSTGNADLDPINKFDVEVAPGYSISKAAMNVAVAKFSAQYKRQGVLFMSICPGMVETGHHKDATPEQMKSLGGLVQKFMQYAPHFTGPATPEAAIKDVISVWERASVENGDGGSYVSHHGNKQWL
ncbi:hypothetical protein L249_1065 [Ophiocordyceps polyrhachis-furcata BCC 54312]|uniref:Ketoreductase (KR) domain-containing protein n=1 Tax=Ophiocordyceps polyrhachis-furcata BCC 54312 TaxID=1330021 RepID=A0A367LES5_9HYPO|nr:hypothetical protein L249_1065 [Ophiocordyceps polyrhachis-furcata BCC 54312]